MNPYTPRHLPLEDIDCIRLIKKVGQANAALARYDGLLHGIVNPSVLLSPLMTQEAVLSSKIEGTQATIDEVFEFEAGGLKEEKKHADVQEILNYRKAVMAADLHIQDYPISLNLILALHKILLESVRGNEKTPGEFRKDQNWIGRLGCIQQEATYVPVSPLRLNEFLENWADYLKHEEIDVLIHTAVVHAQFELIHPFKDGNGRIGRLLIPLFLFQKKALGSPMFYISEYLENNRSKYYESLQRISTQDDWNTWIEFFLDAVISQAEKNSFKVRKILSTYEDMKTKIITLTHSQYAIPALDQIFKKPTFNSSDFIRDSGIPNDTATTIINKLKKNNILKVVREARGRTPAILIFEELLRIVV